VRPPCPQSGSSSSSLDIMSVSRDQATAPAGVSFEVDRFAWADGRLEVTGRWYGIRGRRFLRPTLDVEVDGSPRRMLAVLEHKPWAADDGEEWVAAFEWTGEPVALAVAELAVGPELAVVLPPPTGGPAKKARRARATGDRLEARPPRAQALEAELAEARAEISSLRERLEAEQKAWQERVEQVEALGDESAAAKSAAEAERDEVAAQRDEVAAARAAAIAKRDELVSARDAAIAERDAAVTAREAALADAAKAAAERDKAVREKAAVENELKAAERARDKARQERNEWLTRARDAAAGQATAAEEGAHAVLEPAPAEREPAPAEREPAPAQREPAPAEREPAAAERRARRAWGRPAQAKRKAPPGEEDAPPAEQETPAEAAAVPLQPRSGPAPAPGGGPTGKPRKAQIPPGGILLPPTGPGSHTRRTILSGWSPRVLAPILLVILVVVIAVLIGWAF
jgi:hypothetical protein